MTPEEFSKKMQEIKDQLEDDEEVVHVKMDCLMCTVLEELGYGEGINIFEQTSKWYA